MLWYSLEAPHWGTSNEYPQHMFSWRNKKKYYVDSPSYLAQWRYTFSLIIAFTVNIFYNIHWFCEWITHYEKHAYSNILTILPPKNKNIQIKNSDILHFSAQNIDCGYLLEPLWWGGSNAHPQSMFLSWNKKNNVYSCKPQFYCI